MIGRFLLPIACAAGLASAQSPAELEAVVNTSMGTFRFEFAPDKAPKHVEQFIRLARQGYYDGGAFFRVVANGIIQGGDPLLKDPKTPKNLWGTGGLSMLKGEYSDLKHERGVVSTVAIPGKADSDGAQFFVCVYPQAPLDGQVFGVRARDRGHGRGGEDFTGSRRREWIRRESGAHRERNHREEEDDAVRQCDGGSVAAHGDDEDHAGHDSDQNGAGLGAEPCAQFSDADGDGLV